jgi:hypothetical protein
MEALKDFSTYTAIATFIVYLFGYLALRFHLTALGVVTELGVLDDRYLFVGAKFLVFLAAEIPVLTIVGLPVGLVAWLVWRRMPALHKRARRLLANAPLLLWASVILAIAVIEFWMSACLPIDNLPLAAGPPEPAWMFDLVRNPEPMSRTLFFIAILMCAVLVCMPLIAAWRLPISGRALKALFGLAVLLAAITVLLVPVNFGVLVMPYSMGRVAAVGKTPIPAGQRAWLLWEGKDWMTYFVLADGNRKVVAVPAKEIDRIEVSGNDSLFDVVYSGAGRRR